MMKIMMMMTMMMRTMMMLTSDGVECGPDSVAKYLCQLLCSSPPNYLHLLNMETLSKCSTVPV